MVLHPQDQPAEHSAFSGQLTKVSGICSTLRGKEAVAKTMAVLASARPDLYWVGVYLLRGAELIVGPYVGPTTEHVRIPIGRGVCGTAVALGVNQIVGDVSQQENYLTCNIATKSEIVVLVRSTATGEILGQIDIDSTRLNAFSTADAAALDEVARTLAPHFAIILNDEKCGGSSAAY